MKRNYNYNDIIMIYYYYDIVENALITEAGQPAQPIFRKEKKRPRICARKWIAESTIINKRRIPKLKAQIKVNFRDNSRDKHFNG